MNALSGPRRFKLMQEACATKPHGCRQRYVAGCRCVPCRAANSRYEISRLRAKRNGDWNGLVSADIARAHLRKLSTLGIGRHSVAHASGVSDGVLWLIWSGLRKRIRARTERRLLAVDQGARAGGSIVPADGVWRAIADLLKRGFSKVQIAEWIGNKRALQINRRRVTAATAMKVERMVALLNAGRLRRTR